MPRRTVIFRCTLSLALLARFVGVVLADIFRRWPAPDGTLTDPVVGQLAIATEFGAVNPAYTDAGDHYRITTAALTLRVYKNPLRFALYKADNATLVWSEATGLSWDGTGATQTLSRGADEQFHGTGLRLGANASPAPFYLSTSGYAVMRDTWQPGQYTFASPVTTRHEENRLDAFQGGTGNDTRLIIWDCTATSNQRWTLS
ncbi:hypothetical protein ACIBG8_04175 [Nonomuraea sp. NPDC050556]|uniref:hypothetical protein n=1 Tax=Nonomuraea sp. NPDC050556 TaxID=3364369 RepID=UPI00378E922D